MQIVIFRRYRLEPGSLQEEFKCWIQIVGLWFVWPRIAPSRVSVTVYKMLWALTDGSHRPMLLGCINCDSQPAAVNWFRRSTFRTLPARLMAGGGYRLLASRDFSLASGGGDPHPSGSISYRGVPGKIKRAAFLC